MPEKNVFLDRTLPIWPNVVRVRVGTHAEAANLKTAFKEVMDAPPVTSSIHDPFANIAFRQLS